MCNVSLGVLGRTLEVLGKYVQHRTTQNRGLSVTPAMRCQVAHDVVTNIGEVLVLRAYCARRGWDTHPSNTVGGDRIISSESISEK